MKQVFDIVSAGGASGAYHHGNVPGALQSAARDLLEKGEDVGLRELSRRIGVSSTAVYRHYASKDDLLASVAASGFRQLVGEIEAAANASADTKLAAGLAYVDFALDNPGLFALMFGRCLAQRHQFPALRKAADQTFEALERFGLTDGPRRRPTAWGEQRLGPWCYLHGLSQLSTAKLASKGAVRRLALTYLSAEPDTAADRPVLTIEVSPACETQWTVA